MPRKQRGSSCLWGARKWVHVSSPVISMLDSLYLPGVISRKRHHSFRDTSLQGRGQWCMVEAAALRGLFYNPLWLRCFFFSSCVPHRSNLLLAVSLFPCWPVSVICLPVYFPLPWVILSRPLRSAMEGKTDSLGTTNTDMNMHRVHWDLLNCVIDSHAWT